MRRREFIVLLGGAAIAAPRAAMAQTSSRVYRLGGSQAAHPFTRTPRFQEPADVLAQRGYTLGKNWPMTPAARRPVQQDPALIQDLKQAKSTCSWSSDFRRVTAKSAGIPSVIAFGSGDPVATGLVEDLARPAARHRHCGRAATLVDQAAGAADGFATENAAGRDAVEQDRSRHVAALRGLGEGGPDLGASVFALGYTSRTISTMRSQPWTAIRRMPSSWCPTRSPRSTASASSTYAAERRLPAIYEYDRWFGTAA